MAPQHKGSEASSSIAGNPPVVPGHASTTSTRPVLSTTWRGRNVEVTLPYPEHPVPRGDWWEPGDVSHYIYSTAPQQHPNLPRAYQHVPEQDRFKRQTDIANPYVRLPKPKPVDSRAAKMAGGPSSLAVSKSRSKTSKNRSNYTASSRHSSLLDTDIGMEGWPISESSSSGKEVKKEVEEKGKIEHQTAMGQLLDLEEQSTEPVETVEMEKQATKKSLMQQLYELQGLEVDAVTTTTTTTTTITSIKAKPASTTSSKYSTETKKHHDQLSPQLTTFDNLSTSDLSHTEPHYDSKQPSVANPTNKVPSTPASASVSNEQDPTPDTITNANDTPSSPSTIPQPPSPPLPSSPPAAQPVAQLALQTLRSQELALETSSPLGTEISTWAAALDTVPSSTYNDKEEEREAEQPDGGYIRRFATPKGKASDTEPNNENAMVKWDPFGGVWGYAIDKKVWVVEEKKKPQINEEEKKMKEERRKIDLKKKEKEAKEEEKKEEKEAGKEEEKAETKEAEKKGQKKEEKGEEKEKEDKEAQKEEKKKETCFDDLESFWSKTEEKQAKKDDVKEPEKKHSYFDELEMFMNS
ncbi:MAG: hypothetical protein Q9226_007674 [Calogaya cf. arnoldii]